MPTYFKCVCDMCRGVDKGGEECKEVYRFLFSAYLNAIINSYLPMMHEQGKGERKR